MSDELQYLPSTATGAEIAAAMLEAGGVVVEDILSPEQVDHYNQALIEVLDAEKKREERLGHGRESMDHLMPSTMHFATNLPAHHPDIAVNVAGNPVILDAVARVLNTEPEHVLLNTTQVIESWPGSPAQQLHRDDVTWAVPAPRPELCVVTLYALQNFVPEAGGTVIVPGSHKWPSSRVLPDYDEAGVPEGIETDLSKTIRLSMKPGSCFLFLGSVVHGGGANVSEDLVRRYFHIGYCHEWLRPVENQYVTLTREQVMALPQNIQHLLGYDRYRFELGHAFNMSPIEFFKQEAGQ